VINWTTWSGDPDLPVNHIEIAKVERKPAFITINGSTIYYYTPNSSNPSQVASHQTPSSLDHSLSAKRNTALLSMGSILDLSLFLLTKFQTALFGVEVVVPV
jgi:hypothetical protein